MNIKLQKNLRRDILRGHPWVYRDALKSPPDCETARLAKISDNKGELGWGLYDPHSALALRVISLDKRPPNFDVYANRLNSAHQTRQAVRSVETTAYRLVNGEGDLLPGMICDMYNDIAVLQFDGRGPGEFWDLDAVANWLLTHTECTTVVEKSRSGAERGMQLVAGTPCENQVTIREHGLSFEVELAKGQKTGFFLDQRENRKYVADFTKGLSVLNLFSYTGGFSVAAGRGGATRVASVDSASGAIDMANANWVLNGLAPDTHEGICADVFQYLEDTPAIWDVVIVDPPSMARSEKQKPQAMTAYTKLFIQAAQLCPPGGHLVLSSCSSHIHFEDFFEIITQALSKSRRKGRYLRISGQGADHPFPHACPEMRYLKFAHLLLD